MGYESKCQNARSIMNRCVELVARAALLAVLVSACSCTQGSRGLSKPTPFSQVSEQSVSWDEAVRLIRGGTITTVGQTHNLTVGLSGGGHRYSTREPEIDAVWKLVNAIDPKHERIRFHTE